jgi:acyl carrier protein
MSKWSFDKVNVEIMKMLKEQLRITSVNDQFNDDLLFGAASGFDSTRLLEFILLIEDKFDIIIPDEDLVPGNFSSISKIANYIVNIAEV